MVAELPKSIVVGLDNKSGETFVLSISPPALMLPTVVKVFEEAS